MSRRLLKAAEAIREVVSMAILTEVRDPRVKHVTVISIEVAPDMKSAQVNVSIMGTEKEQQLALSGLRHSAGFLQKRIADRIDTRYTPRLSFEMDKGAKNALEVHRILSEVLPKPPIPVSESSTEAAEPDNAAEDNAAEDGEDGAADEAR